jgi:VIT1/CCC1 family predicted Fe2+/Mn2+ transporter
MFISYFFAGFIPLFPYFFSSSIQSVWYSIGLSLLALYILGFVSGRLFHISSVRSGLRMLTLGGVAIGVGVVVGRLVPH